MPRLKETGKNTKLSLSKSNIEMVYSIEEFKDLMYFYQSIEDINDNSEGQALELDLSNLGISYQHKLAFNNKQHTVSLYFRVFFHLNNIQIIKYGIRVNFRIENYKEVVTFSKQNNPPYIHEKFLTSFLGIAISTARGTLIAHLKGTEYENLYIPFFYPRETC